jgi:hypothetical protein
VSDNAVIASDNFSGGGIDLQATSFTITSSTIANNSSGNGMNLGLHSAVTLKNTILAGGAGNCSGVLPTSQGYNLADDATCNLVDPTDQLTLDAKLAGSLASNGGPTQTYALLDGSPAIDKGISSMGETVDQRGDQRPYDFPGIGNAAGGDGTDIGAFEVQDTTPPDTIIDTAPGTTNDPTPTFTFHSTEPGSTFQCRVDAHVFAACNSPRTVAHLADGSHTFRVRAKDSAGNLDPSPAMRSFAVKTALVSRGSGVLLVGAAPGAKDNVRITKPSPATIRVTDLPSGLYKGSGIHVVGSGCTRAGDYTANCDAAGINVVSVSSFGLIDRVTNGTDISSHLEGGSGNDVLIGGRRGDTLLGGIGADTMKGMDGSDTLKARDQASDSLVNCDGGASPDGGDTAIVDALPNDPATAVVGCEDIRRP